MRQLQLKYLHWHFGWNGSKIIRTVSEFSEIKDEPGSGFDVIAYQNKTHYTKEYNAKYFSHVFYINQILDNISSTNQFSVPCQGDVFVPTQVQAPEYLN